MNGYVMRRNIEAFERALEAETDHEGIATLKELLKIEKAKHAAYYRGR